MQEKCGCGGLTQWRWWPPARFWRCSASAHSEEWCPVSSWCPPAASLWLQAPETESGSLLQPGFQKIRTKCPNMFAVECTAHIYVFFSPFKIPTCPESDPVFCFLPISPTAHLGQLLLQLQTLILCDGRRSWGWTDGRHSVFSYLWMFLETLMVQKDIHAEETFLPLCRLGRTDYY